MSRNRRESHGLGRIFSQAEAQPTPYKQTPMIARSAKKAARQGSLHDPIWDAPTGKVVQTPGQRMARPTRTPTQRQGDGEYVEMAGILYRFLHSTGFEAETGGTIPGNSALTPMNADILKMFNFLFELVDPGRQEVGVVVMLEELGYGSIDQAFRRTFSNSHILANTASIWPKIVKALAHIVGIIESSRTVPLPKSCTEAEQLRMLQKGLIYANFCGYNTDNSNKMLGEFLANVEEQTKIVGDDINKLEGAISANKQLNERYLAAMGEQEKVKEDEQNLEQFMTRVQAQIASYEPELEKLGLELLAAHETLAGLETQKNRYARQFEQAGVSVAKLEDFRYQQKSLEEDLVRVKDRVTDLEINTKSKWEEVARAKATIKIVLEKVCERLAIAVPDQDEWSKSVIEMFASLDAQRRDLMVQATTTQEAIINAKVGAAAFNSQFEMIQAKQARLEAAAKSIEEKNEFQVRELEIKTTIINQRVEAMKRHCQKMLLDSEKEHNSRRAERLELEREGAKLDNQAVLCIQSVTSKTRAKIRRLDSVQRALLPGLQQLGSSAEAYAAVASEITKRAFSLQLPAAKKPRGSKNDQVERLLESRRRAISKGAAP